MLNHEYAVNSVYSQADDTLGATQISKKKVKTESKENHGRLISGPPWPPKTPYFSHTYRESSFGGFWCIGGREIVFGYAHILP